jgi:hypothetical protein
MGKSVDLQDIFLNISDDIEFTLPCATRHLELLILTYADFYRKSRRNFGCIWINKRSG